MKPSAIQDAVVSAIQARYPLFRVEAHGGNFSERELPLLLAKAPAILVCCVRIQDMKAHGEQLQATFDWALFILGADQGTTERDTLALDTVTDLLAWLPHQKWGLSAARLPHFDTLAADNLYTGSTNILRVAVWGLRWKQNFIFD